jgi:DNA-directed RNA polymerase specialized sigma24 family protein
MKLLTRTRKRIAAPSMGPGCFHPRNEYTANFRTLESLLPLPRRDRQIVTLYHWRGATMREIGRVFNINESRVSQIHKRALERMAGALRSFGITSSSSILFR